MSTQVNGYPRFRRPPLRLSPLLRFALATAKPGPDGKPNLLPMKIPHKCCGKGFHCTNIVRWQIKDGVNSCFICGPCCEQLWESHNALDFSMERV